MIIFLLVFLTLLTVNIDSIAYKKNNLNWCKIHCNAEHKQCSKLDPEKMEKCLGCWHFHAEQTGIRQCLQHMMDSTEKIENYLNQEADIRVTISYDNQDEKEIRKKSKSYNKWEKIIKKINELQKSLPFSKKKHFSESEGSVFKSVKNHNHDQSDSLGEIQLEQDDGVLEYTSAFSVVTEEESTSEPIISREKQKSSFGQPRLSHLLLN